MISLAQVPSGYHILKAGPDLYIATPEGLYRFSPDGPNLNLFTELHGLARGRIRFLEYDDGLVWVGSDSGIANGDVRFQDWRVVMRGEPVGIGYDDDYVYLALRRGLFRYEKITEDIDPISKKGGIILNEDGRLLVVRPDASFYYEIESETEIRTGIPADLSGRYPITTLNWIGLIDTNRIILRQKKGGSFEEFKTPEIVSYTIKNDSILFATESGIYLFDPNTNSFHPYTFPYQGKINCLARSGPFLAVGTDSGIYEINGGIRLESKRTGMVEDSIIALAYLGDNLIAVTRDYISYRTSSGWQSFKREKKGPRPALIYWDKTGTYLAPFGQRIRFLGRISYNYRIQHISGEDYYGSDTTIDLTGQTEILDGRLSGFYDSSEPERIDYGIGYKSDHLIRSLFYGKDRFGLPQSKLTPTLKTRGFRGEAGSWIQVLGFYGRPIGRYRYQVFTGNLIEKDLVVQDSSYQKDRFFTIDTLEGRLEIKDLEVYYDDLDPLTNDDHTLIGEIIGGRRGDYDRLVPVLDLSYREDLGVLDLKRSRPGTLAVRYDGKEVILDSSHNLKNRYWVGSGILPFSFELTITDTIGTRYPLSRFGIDQDNNNLVDEDFIDYESGILRFPRPIINDTISYRLRIHYSSYSLLYQLEHYPIVRGSDRVLLDGEELNSGVDYIIDYSTGLLLVLKPVTPASEIEVYYEEEVVDSEQARGGIALRFLPSDNFKASPGFYHDGTNTFTGPVEIRTRHFFGRGELISQSGTYGGKGELVVKKGGSFVGIDGLLFPDGLEDFGLLVAKKGRWIRKGGVKAGVEIYDLKLTGDYHRGEAKDSLDEYDRDERKLMLDLRPKRLPYLFMERGRQEGFGLKKDFYRIETGHGLGLIKLRFGLGKEKGTVEVTDLYSEVNIFNSRFYQRRIKTDNYITDRLELGSFIDLKFGFTLRASGYVRDFYDRSGYTRFNRYLLLTGDLALRRFPLVLTLGHGLMIGGFGPGQIKILDLDPKTPYLNRDRPTILGVEFTGNLIFSSLVRVIPSYTRDYATVKKDQRVESLERAEIPLSGQMRLIGHHNLKGDTHNQYLDLEYRAGGLVLTPGVGANLGEYKEAGPRMKIEFVPITNLRIYNQNEVFFGADHSRSTHSLSIQLNPIKPLLFRTTGSYNYYSHANDDYTINLSAYGLF